MQNDDIVKKIIEDKEHIERLSYNEPSGSIDAQYYDFVYKGILFILIPRLTIFGGYSLKKDNGFDIKCSNAILRKLRKTLEQKIDDENQKERNQELNEIRNKIITLSDKRDNELQKILS